jgi:hypothetical protein
MSIIDFSEKLDKMFAFPEIMNKKKNLWEIVKFMEERKDVFSSVLYEIEKCVCNNIKEEQLQTLNNEIELSIRKKEYHDNGMKILKKYDRELALLRGASKRQKFEEKNPDYKITYYEAILMKLAGFGCAKSEDFAWKYLEDDTYDPIIKLGRLRGYFENNELKVTW